MTSVQIEIIDCDGKICGMGRHVSGGRYVCPHNNLAVKRPDIAAEWDYQRNSGRPEDYTLKSHKRAWWICSLNPCGCHKWESYIYNRSNGYGCPYCPHQMICPHISLAALHPEIACEWDYQRNAKSPWQVAPKSNEKYWWICSKNPCGCHRWQAPVYSRTYSENKCPFCSNQAVCLHNSLYYLHPDIAAEWDYQRNLDKPWEITPGSNVTRAWICKENPLHRWMTSSDNRVGKKSGCPHCCNSRGYSRAQIEWLQGLEIKHNIKIEHALSSEGEFFIQGVGKVDGYCREHNIVFEYHGDYWHGNPVVYPHDKINETSGERFGDLYQKTIERDRKIMALGYHLVVKWETDIVEPTDKFRTMTM